MYNEILYHGTNRVRGTRFINSNRMQISPGDKHWLGDGSYLFEECLYAYKWIVDMFIERHPETIIDERLVTEYQILECTVNTARNRVFDLRKAEYKLIFDEAHNNLEKNKEYSQRFREAEMAEGVVINYLFNEFDYYRDNFDVVIAVFTKDRGNYRGKKLRLAYMPQTQICIKNLNVVTDIEDYDYSSSESAFRSLIDQLARQKDNQPAYYRSKFETYKS